MSPGDTLMVALLLVILTGALLIVYSTVRTGMSPMPSSAVSRAALCDHVRETALPDGPVIDIGSGWGHLLISLGRAFPERRVIGYEVSVLPFLVSRVWVRLAGMTNVEVHRADFFAYWESLREPGAAWVTYLHRPAMQRLAEGLRAGYPMPQWLFSNNFSLPGVTPDATRQQTDFYRSPLYRYRLS